MSPIEIFLISFFGSFLGSSLAVIITFYFYKKQVEEIKKLKKSLQNTVRRLKKK